MATTSVMLFAYRHYSILPSFHSHQLSRRGKIIGFILLHSGTLLWVPFVTTEKSSEEFKEYLEEVIVYKIMVKIEFSSCKSHDLSFFEAIFLSLMWLCWIDFHLSQELISLQNSTFQRLSDLDFLKSLMQKPYIKWSKRKEYGKHKVIIKESYFYNFFQKFKNNSMCPLPELLMPETYVVSIHSYSIAVFLTVYLTIACLLCIYWMGHSYYYLNTAKISKRHSTLQKKYFLAVAIQVLLNEVWFVKTVAFYELSDLELVVILLDGKLGISNAALCFSEFSTYHEIGFRAVNSC